MTALALLLCLHAGDDAKLDDLFKAYLAKTCEQRPVAATQMGEHAHDARLDDLSDKALAAREALVRDTLADLPRKVDYKKLSRDSQIDYEIFRHALRFSVWQMENAKPYAQDPLLYNEIVSDGVYLLFTQSTLPKARNVRSAAARIVQIPRVLQDARRLLKSPPEIFTKTAIARNKGAIAFYSGGIWNVSGENPATSELRGACKKAVAALKSYGEFLEKELLPRSKGEWRIGKKKFAQKLELELDAGVAADQVLEDAEAEARRVTGELYVVARQLWAKAQPKAALPPDDEAGRRETVLKVLAHTSSEHGKVEGLLGEAKALSTRIKKFIADKDIVGLPVPDRCRIVEMPEFQRGFSVAYLNPAPPLDPKASSYYAISPPPAGWDSRKVESYLREYNRSMMAVLTIHEAYPGHYVQLEYSNRHPSFLRRVLQSGVFCEGWAVYTEQMMLDQGFGDGDPVLRLNQLKFYLRAVINAILDHKMHCGTMSDAEAMKLLAGRGFQSEGEALGKVARSKLSSCQLSTYFVGRMAFCRLRQKTQRELGDKFALGRFHEAVLSNGSLPVKYLPEVTAERLKKPR